jgi:HPt (histidine-containing phosphotransfer) domain-containing protein
MAYPSLRLEEQWQRSRRRVAHRSRRNGVVTNQAGEGGSTNSIDSAGGDASAASQTAVLDLEHLDCQVQGDEPLRHELLRLFAEQLAAMAPLVCGPPSRQRREAAHTLKGASLAIGAFALARACEGVERNGGEEIGGKVALLIGETQRRLLELLAHRS